MKKNKYQIAGNVYPPEGFNIEEFLTKKGIKFQAKDKDWLRMSCPFPNHNDENPSFFIHRKHCGYNCFVCGSGSWFDFLKLMGWTEEAIASNIIIGIVHSILWKEVLDEIKIDKASTLYYQKSEIPEYLEKISLQFKHKKLLDYLVKRKIDFLLKCFKLYCSFGYDKIYGGQYKNRIMIPVHDPYGNFLWFEGRSISSKTKRKYYRPYGVEKTKILYNFHRIKDRDYVIVVEGILDAMVLWRYNLPAVCCWGTTISEEQISLLVEFNEVVIALDNDDAGIKGYVKVKGKIKNAGVKVTRIIFPKHKDVVDLSEKSILRLLQLRKVI